MLFDVLASIAIAPHFSYRPSVTVPTQSIQQEHLILTEIPMQGRNLISHQVANFALDSSGFIRRNHVLIGKFDYNSYIRNIQDQILGRIDTIGYVRDQHDQVLGRMDTIGYIRDRSGQILAQYTQDQSLKDRQGRIIARNISNPKLALIIIFFRHRLL